MKQIKLSLLFLAALMALVLPSACTRDGKGGSAATSTEQTAADSAAMPELKGDDNINRATRFYAGLSREGISMTQADANAWEGYSKEIKRLLSISLNTRKQLDSLVNHDCSDFRNKVDLVFYPFSGADFVYPITIFPNADTYILCGLEKTGTPIGADIKTNFAHYESYRKALSTFLRISYFITKDMAEDLNNDDLDGVCPVITMLMATAGYSVISITNMRFDDDGNLVKADNGKGNVMQYKFFRDGSKHEQTLYYISADVENRRMDEKLKKYIEKTLPGHTVASYLKAASYLMSMANFSTMRDYIVNNSQYVLGDDSGVPYKYLVDKFDVTLYGVYKRPLPVFTDACIQPELDQAYKDQAGSVKPLGFRIGYNMPSNWQVSRRKGTK